MTSSGSDGKTRPDVTDAELSVLKSLWQRGMATIRELTDDLYPQGGASHYATVQKLLDRLSAKGFVDRFQQGRANVFRPTVERDDLISQRLQATADRLCDGALAPLFTQLVGSARLTTDDIGALRELVRSLDSAED